MDPGKLERTPSTSEVPDSGRTAQTSVSNEEQEKEAVGGTRSAEDRLLDMLADMMSHRGMREILDEQCAMLQDAEIAKEKVLNLNLISEMKYREMAADLQQATHMMSDMKKNLESVFRRIRSMKTKLASQYPEAYAKGHEKCQVKLDDDDEFDG